jgi:hypothetical protein
LDFTVGDYNIVLLLNNLDFSSAWIGVHSLEKAAIPGALKLSHKLLGVI